MTQQAPKGLYIYQPFGVQHPINWISGRIFAIGGLPMEATITGLTKPEAERVLRALRQDRLELEPGVNSGKKESQDDKGAEETESAGRDGRP